MSIVVCSACGSVEVGYHRADCEVRQARAEAFREIEAKCAALSAVHPTKSAAFAEGVAHAVAHIRATYRT